MARSTPPSPGRTRPPRRRGVIRAIFAVTGVVDEVNDLIVPGAFTRTLATRRVKAVWHHDWTKPVGTVLDVEEWKPGDRRFASIPGGAVWPAAAGALVATIAFNLRTRRGREAYEQVRQWHDNGEAAFSIGYKVTSGGASKRHDGIRVIHDLELYEVSPVLHGAHPMTRSLEVKAVTDGPPLEYKSTWSAVELKAAESQTGRGVMVALQVPEDIAAQLARPDGTAPESLHVTLAYLGAADALGGNPDDLGDLVAQAVTGAPALSGSIGGIGRFPDAGDGEPVWVPVDVPGLAELRQRIVDALSTSVYSGSLRSEHGFTPHITLGYDLADVAPVPATPIEFTQVAVVLGPDTRLVPLSAPERDPEPGGFEAKSAADIVLEAKALSPSAPPTPGRDGGRSAARAVLEAKSAPLPPEEPVPAPLPWSYEQLRDRLSDAARTLLGEGDGYAVVEATYPDHVIVSVGPDDPTTYSIPYTATARGVDLGVPAPVELTTVAVPVTGEQRPVEGDEAIEARFIQPTASALRGATALIGVSGAGPGHLESLKPTITGLLTSLREKGLPIPDMDDDQAPEGSSLDLWADEDDEFEVTDGWSDDDPDDIEPAASDEAAAGDPGGPGEDVPPGEAADPDHVPSGPDDAAPDDEEEEMVRLEPDEVKAMLAFLTL
ncbi:2'-5' RNA ligase family protein [Streptomyces sp. NPDC097619]|uniref:2'-5' RNA ligase family protein n=1 Tax=Streptomyces sp. NPDC097619 TaxID=3157228 RepID=UPI00331DBDF9